MMILIRQDCYWTGDLLLNITCMLMVTLLYRRARSSIWYLDRALRLSIVIWHKPRVNLSIHFLRVSITIKLSCILILFFMAKNTFKLTTILDGRDS